MNLEVKRLCNLMEEVQKTQTVCVQLIHDLKESIEEVRDERIRQTVRQDNLAEEVRLDQDLMTKIFNVHRKTLYVWRNMPTPGNLPSHKTLSGQVYYKLEEVIRAVRLGKFISKKSRQIEIVNTLEVYRKGFCDGMVTEL